MKKSKRLLDKTIAYWLVKEQSREKHKSQWMLKSRKDGLRELSPQASALLKSVHLST